MAGNSGVSLKWNGLDRAIHKACRNMAERQELMSSIGEALVSGAVLRFSMEEDPEGRKWQPSRRAQTTGGQTLNDTGRLRDSIDYATTPETVLVGTNAKYARIHQLGGKIRPKSKKRLKFKGIGGEDVFAKEITIPARPFIGISADDLEEVKETIAEYMGNAFGRR